MKITLKENIELGQIVRFEAAAGNILESYVHIQGGRGVNAVLVELQGGNAELAHDIAVHCAFAKPGYLTRDQVPEADVAAAVDEADAAMREHASHLAGGVFVCRVVAGARAAEDADAFHKGMILVGK